MELSSVSMEPTNINIEPTICQLCREPIWNFICIDCLKTKVERWIPNTLSQGFNQFHQNLQNHFSTTPDNYEPCLKCEVLNEKPICPHCYTHETFYWLKENDAVVARAFSKIFFFYKFEGTEILKSDCLPVETFKEKEGDIGICDNCGDNNYLENIEGGWYCEVCRN